MHYSELTASILQQAFFSEHFSARENDPSRLPVCRMLMFKPDGTIEPKDGFFKVIGAINIDVSL